MPKKIVPERRRTASLRARTQQRPEWNSSKKDVERFAKELTKNMKEFAPSFQRVEQRQPSQTYVHGLLVALAHHFLVRLKTRFHQQAPALTIYQVRLLLACVLPAPVFDIQAALQRVRYYQKRNFAAYCSHGKACA